MAAIYTVFPQTLGIRYKTASSEFRRYARKHASLRGSNATWPAIPAEVIEDVQHQYLSPSEWLALLPAYLAFAVSKLDWSIAEAALIPESGWDVYWMPRNALLSQAQLRVIQSYVDHASTHGFTALAEAWARHQLRMEELQAEVANLEQVLEEAFGGVDPPPMESIPGWMLNSQGEIDFMITAYGRKRYSEIDTRVLPNPEGLNHRLGDTAFAYYIGGVALLAVRSPLDSPADVLANSFCDLHRDLANIDEGVAAMSTQRLHAVASVLRYIRERAQEANDERLAQAALEAIGNIGVAIRRRGL